MFRNDSLPNEIDLIFKTDLDIEFEPKRFYLKLVSVLLSRVNPSFSCFIDHKTHFDSIRINKSRDISNPIQHNRKGDPFLLILFESKRKLICS